VAQVSSSVEDAVAALASGGVIAIPTDTVYGIATVANRQGAAAALSSAKGRSSDIPLQVLVSSREQAESIGIFGDTASRIAERLWPGAVTLVVARRKGVSLDLGGDATTVGIRWPDHELVVSLCEKVGPLAATSANRHGEPPLQNATDVATAFGYEIALVFDGGSAPAIASTVVDVTGESPKILRIGEIPESDVMSAAGT
jgi:tRNA threonylcarbamoyl adenosine modification protein (Sua5/YciO/YrdC/YwlC family)